jgi:phospholipase C
LRAFLVGFVILATFACAQAGRETCEPASRLRQQYPHEAWDVAAAAQRDACTFGSGSTTIESVPGAPQIPDALKHVIVVLRENRSFDHYLGGYTPRAGRDDYADPLPLDPAKSTNPDPSARQRGAPVRRFHEQRYCTDNPAHEWSDVHLQFNNGHLDGFVSSSNRRGVSTTTGGCLAMGYYDRDDLPFYYWLADNFAISDRYFSAILGPTLPNVMYYYRATSCGLTENLEALVNVDLAGACPPEQLTIFQQLEGHASYRVYSDARPAAVTSAVGLAGYPPQNVGSIATFENDVRADQLAQVVFVEPNNGHTPVGTPNDEHPPSNVQDGQSFLFRVVSAIMASPSVWESSIIFVTWDEHGGYYDHVTPPIGCPPDDNLPKDSDFAHLGFRTPFFAISPFAKRGYVSHYTSDHTSILRFVEAWQGLGALTARDANAWPLFDMFDFSAPPPASPSPPDASLATISTDPAHVGTCGLPSPGSSCDP